MQELRILIPLLVNVLLTVFFFIAIKKNKFAKINKKVLQLIIGVIFGASAAFASEFGVNLNDTIINIRDSAPILAGLTFGPIAGIVAGVVGGTYRALSILWGAGKVTVVACSISTFMAGVIASVLRYFMFDNKRTTWGFGVGITLVIEIFHMLMIFITNINDIELAYSFIEKCTLLMIFANCLCVGLAIFIISKVNKDKSSFSIENEGISQKFQRWLLTCILVTYAVTSVLSFTMQSNVAKKDTNNLLVQNIEDVSKEIIETNDKNLLEITNQIKEEYETGNYTLQQLKDKYEVDEINVVNTEGYIVDTTGEHLNYYMGSGEQSKEFLSLLTTRTYYVQKYGPISYDNITYRKYAGYRLSNNEGFIQIGYNAISFQKDMEELITTLSKYRHIGTGGFLAICDSQFNIICDPTNEFSGQNLKTIGINIDTNTHEAKGLYKDEVDVKNYKAEFYFSYEYNEGYYIVAAIPVSESMFVRNVSIYLDIFLQIIIFSTLYVLIYFLIKKVIINNLYKINTKLSEITSGNLDVVVDVRSIKEFSSLSDDINHTVNTLKRYIDEAASRIDKELEYAKSIQLSSLPSNFPAFPNQSNFDIYACMHAAKEVGGDFYDFYRIDKNRFAILVADVSGKGIPAAMFMMKAKAIIKNLAEQRIEVNDILTKANEMLCENNDSGMFVTAWMGIIDLTTGVLKYANAGHNPPLIYNGSEFTYLKSRPGFVLAGMENIKYRVNEITINPGDRILLYTDGVTEATDINQNMYGENRLLSLVNNNYKASTKELIELIKEDIDNFVDEAPQFDDITILLFDLFKLKSTGILKERTFEAKDSSLDSVLEFIEEELNKNECSKKTLIQIKIAIEEVFVNIAHYSYPNKDGNVKIMFGYNDKDRTATIHLIDNGIPFNPLLKDDPDITLSADDRQIGGLGIFITKKTMDNVLYTYENKQNILTIIKKI